MIERRLTRILGAYWRIMAEKNPGWTDKVPRIEQQMDSQKTKKAANLRMPDIDAMLDENEEGGKEKPPMTRDQFKARAIETLNVEIAKNSTNKRKLKGK